MGQRAEIEEAGTLVVLGILGLLNYAWWGVRILTGHGIPDWARSRTSK
jgi:hypothetical protein